MILHPRQIADIAGGDDIKLVLDRPRMGAVAHAQMPVARVGGIGREDDLRALVGQAPGEFGKLRVVADQHAHRAAISGDDLDRVAALDVPPIALIGRGMDLLLGVDRAVAQEDIGHVLKVAVIGARGVRAADDIDVEPYRQRAHELDEGGRMARQRGDAFLRRQPLVLQRQQRDGEHFREDAEIGAIVRADIDEILHIALKRLQRGDRAHLELHGRNPHRVQRTPAQRPVPFHIGGVAPDHQSRAAVAVDVFGQIAAQHALGFKAHAHLEIGDRIAHLARHHRFKIIFRIRVEFALAAIAGQAPAEHDAFQPSILAQRLARVV